jgi:2-methylcitrate dehydratase
MPSNLISRRSALKTAAASVVLLSPSALWAQQHTTVVEDIARWIVDLRYEQLPPNVIATAKRALFDSVGCLLGGLDASPVRMAERVVALQGGNPQATAIGLGRKVTCDQAAFLNAMALRYLDYNDYAAMGRPHHSSINIAPALAVAEMQGLTGKDLLLGIVVGYEMQIRLRDAVGGRGREGWDGTSTTVQYSSAAAAGKLLGLNAEQLANALAIAGSNASTLAEVRRGEELTPAKGSAEPMAARNGTFAALLARAGLSYPLTILEGDNGYGKIVTGSLNEAVLRRRPSEFEILKSSIKLWPCVGTAQAPIAAALEIRRQMQPGDEISGVTVSLSEFAYDQQQRYPDEINTREHADHSVSYLVARALLSGDITVNDFEESRYKAADATALTKKVVLRSDASIKNDELGADIETRLANGRALQSRVPIPPGDMRNPADDATLSRKFLALAEKPLGAGRAQTAAQIIRTVDSVSDLSVLISAITPRPA